MTSHNLVGNESKSSLKPPKPAQFFVFTTRTAGTLDTSQPKYVWPVPRDTRSTIRDVFYETPLLRNYDVFIVFCESTTGEFYGYAQFTGFSSSGTGMSTDHKSESTKHTSLGGCFPSFDPPSARATDSQKGTSVKLQPTSNLLSHAPELRMDIFELGHIPSLCGRRNSERYGPPCGALLPLRRADSPTDRVEEPPVWLLGDTLRIIEYGARLNLEWITTQRMPFRETYRLRDPWGQTLLWRHLQQSDYGIEIDATIGMKLLDIWRQYVEETNNLKIAQNMAMSVDSPDLDPRANTWAMRVLNLPGDTTLAELYGLFMPQSFPLATGSALSMTFLPAPIYWHSGSALVYYSSEVTMQAALQRFNGSRLRPGDSFSPLLLCLPSNSKPTIPV
ncbi:hypothetical protein MIND_00797100 [Mycena indigotica]|uniref:YTH domain-containing protein n=1 Tax=Mycena indigotica TaxID=2126181 RepID=A0A8H6W487_9AGAR|nr:uncharacterized protein MIND_00797100 [Mycena indigotica]KAF7302296.1 hypothetical protein MIND_00797100 [Mycena indigotica]